MSVFIKIASLLFVSFFLASCSEVEKPPLKVSVSSWPGYEPLVLAMEKGMYQQNVKIVRFSTPVESFRALRDGSVDVAAFTFDEAVQYAKLKKIPKIFHVVDISNGGDSIVAKPEIKSLDDLKGKTIGLEKSALANYMLHRALDFTDKVSVDDVKLMNVEIGKHAQAFAKNEVDALITYEPSKTKAINNGAHEIFSSKQIPNEVVDILLAEEGTLKSRKEDIQDLLDGWFKAIDYIEQNPEESYIKMASYEGITPAEFKAAYEDLIIPTRQQVANMLSKEHESSLMPVFERLVDVMLDRKMLDSRVSVENMMLEEEQLKGL